MSRLIFEEKVRDGKRSYYKIINPDSNTHVGFLFYNNYDDKPAYFLEISYSISTKECKEIHDFMENLEIQIIGENLEKDLKI